MTNRLIDILKNKPYGYSSYEDFADYLLENDVVDVIRCKDCGYFHEDPGKKKFPYCNRPFEQMVVRLPDDFCSKAVRKND